MLYTFAHFLRDRVPFLWDLIEVLNSFLFSLRYGKKLKEVKVLSVPDTYRVVPISEVPTEELVGFFGAQPKEAFTFFKPHGFDAGSIRKLQKNRAFLGYVLKKTDKEKVNSNADGMIVGYCFVRAFFHGKGFRGRMVDVACRGEGIGTMMNRLLNEVGFGIGLRLFETVSKNNVPSYRSVRSSSDFRVVEELPHDELFIEILDSKDNG